MTSNTLTSNYENLNHRLQDVKGKILLTRMVECTACGVIAGILGVAAVLLLDGIFRLSLVSRFVIAVLGVVGFLVALVRGGMIPLIRSARLSTEDLSRNLEHHFPDIESRIVTVIDLVPRFERAESVSRKGFIYLAVQSAYRDTESIDFRESVSTSCAARLSGAVVAMLALCTIFYAVNPSWLQNAIGRYTGLIQEYREMHAIVTLHAEIIESETVHVVSGKTEVAAIRGSDIRVKLQAESNVQMPVKLSLRAKGSEKFYTKELTQVGEETIALAKVDSDMEFYFSYGHEKTENFRIRATDYPKIKNIHLRLRFPDYTRVRPQFIPMSNGKVRALYMTEADVSVVADKPLGRGTFSIYGTRVGVKGHGRRVSTRFLVTKNGQYGIKIIDRDGFASQAPFERTIESLKDLAPTIEVYAPDEVTLGKTAVKGVAVRFRAQDDYGVEKVRLVYQLDVLPGVQLVAKRSEEIRKRERKITPRRVVSMTFPCRFDEMGLQIGEVVTYHLEVEDTDTESGPNVSKSKTMRLVVVGTELREWIELEDEDRWPTDFVGFTGAKRASGLGKPGVLPIVKDSAEKPNEKSAGVTNAMEGFVPAQLKKGFSDYSNSLNEQGQSQ